MSASPGRLSWQWQTQISPILLTMGIAASSANGQLPIISLTDPNFANNPTGAFFATFRVVPGAKLVQQQVATYPMANQAVAANAVIAQPLTVSLQMTCPATADNTVFQKQQKLTALQNALAQHNNSGGTYSVITPAYIYTNCLLLDITDVGAPGTQQQVIWQFNFFQPLVSVAQAQQAQSQLMQKLGGGSAPSVSSSFQSAAGNSGSSVTQLTSGIVDQVSNVGLSGPGVTSVISGTVQNAISGGFSTSDLQSSMVAALGPAGAAAGVSGTALEGAVATALASPANFTSQLLKLSLSSAQSSAGLPVTNPSLLSAI
jgi:hypothetical protein